MNKPTKINREIKIGSIIIGFYLLWAVFWFIYSFFLKGTPLSPYSPQSDITIELLSPGTNGFILGTDIYGRSILEILSSGLLYSLGTALSVSITACSIGLIIGYLSVIGHRYIKAISEMLINLIFVFPSILIAIMVMSITGQSFGGLFFALVITGWPAYARIARGETKRVISLTYVESARAIGVGPMRLFLTVIIPAILPIILVHIVLGLSGVIISEATLGFLGLGGSQFSWGAMLGIAKNVLLEAPFMVIILSFTMAGLIIGLNLLGDGLRDYLDPKT